VDTLNQLGEEFPQEPEIRVTPTMGSIVKEVLGREVELNTYERLFVKEPSPGAEAELDKINNFLKQMMDAVNSGKDYDLRELAVSAGIEYETAKQIADNVEKKIRRI
jgi:hypothetical protein